MKTKYLSILSIVAVLILSGFSFAHAQSDVFTQNLYYGLQNNSQVTQLQEFLTSQNLYSGPITGNYYFLTIGAVKAFQAQQGITPAAGYFGPITMAAANKIADATVSASNNEAITETGTSTPPVVMASTTPQLQLAALMQEVALLEQQLQAQQSSTQQQSQTLQQIAQNTTPPVATVPAPTPTQPQTSTAAPTTRLTVNGSTNSITIPYGTATNISWSSTNASSCNVSPSGWSGASGNQSTGNLTTSQTYSISCTGAGGSTSASLTISVSAAPIPTTLGQAQLTGTNDGTNQLYTGVLDTGLSLFLFDQNGNPITNATATIITDDTSSTGIGFGNETVGGYSVPVETEYNNIPLGHSTFNLVHANVSNPSSPVSLQHNNGYIFGYTPQTDGQHTITVSALGSTQTITVTSVEPPTQTLTVTAEQSLPTSNFVPFNTIMPTSTLYQLDNGNYCYKIADCDYGNVLAVFQFTIGNAGGVSLNGLTINDSVSPATTLPLTNLSLWTGNPLMGSGRFVASAVTATPTSNGYAYTFQWSRGVENIFGNSSVSLMLTGVVPSDSSENGSVHVFSIPNASNVAAQWEAPATSLSINVSGATGSPQTVVATSTTQ